MSIQLEEIECPNCTKLVQVKKMINLFSEKRFYIKCGCGSYYTSEDTLHWTPVIINNIKVL